MFQTFIYFFKDAVPRRTRLLTVPIGAPKCLDNSEMLMPYTPRTLGEHQACRRDSKCAQVFMQAGKCRACSVASAPVPLL